MIWDKHIVIKEYERLAVRIAGFVLIAAALALMAYAVYNIVTSDSQTAQSLEEAEQLLKDMQEMGPEEWSPEPADSMPAEATPTTEQPSATLPAESDESAQPEKSPTIGVLVLESLGNRRVPVINGASAADLNRGAGHHPSTASPGQRGNCLVFGHRNTVFRGFGGLKVGDRVRFEVPGKAYTYAISSMKVIEPGDRVIFSAYDTAVLSLVTCYPFNYVGSAPQRYLVVGDLVEN